MRWAGHVTRTGEESKNVQGFGGKALRKKPLGRPRRRWEDVIRMDLKSDWLWEFRVYPLGSG
jgi:hypothetical protein